MSKPAPDDAVALREYALAYLARFAATQAGLRRVLERRIARWERTADPDTAAEKSHAAKAAIPEIVARLVAVGAVDDAAFAQARTRRLARAGKSRAATAAHLAAKGVDRATSAAALAPDPEGELSAAVALAARRRIGPFHPSGVLEPARWRRELAMLARAGFPRDIAERALRLDPAEATALIIALRG